MGGWLAGWLAENVIHRLLLLYQAVCNRSNYNFNLEVEMTATGKTMTASRIGTGLLK